MGLTTGQASARSKATMAFDRKEFGMNSGIPFISGLGTEKYHVAFFKRGLSSAQITQ
jgi:polyisoprenoid-binding protein YceI